MADQNMVITRAKHMLEARTQQPDWVKSIDVSDDAETMAYPSLPGETSVHRGHTGVTVLEIRVVVKDVAAAQAFWAEYARRAAQ